MKKKRYLPFGYQMEKGEIIPHPDEGPLVQAIFSKYIERAALSTLAKYASLSGIPYREGAGQWNKTMICRILDNSKYAGDEGFPPLVSKEQWEEAAFLRAAKALSGPHPRCRCGRSLLPRQCTKSQTRQLLFRSTQKRQR